MVPVCDTGPRDAVERPASCGAFAFRISKKCVGAGAARFGASVLDEMRGDASFVAVVFAAGALEPCLAFAFAFAFAFSFALALALVLALALALLLI